MVWVVVVMAVSFLAYYATSDPDLRSGESMYDIVIFFVLGLAMLIVPSLTATSVNGDREHGVLATLQTTLLTAWDLALGKLLAAWVTALDLPRDGPAVPRLGVVRGRHLVEPHPALARRAGPRARRDLCGRA